MLCMLTFESLPSLLRYPLSSETGFAPVDIIKYWSKMYAFLHGPNGENPMRRTILIINDNFAIRQAKSAISMRQ